MSLFASVELAPRDPILGLNEQFNADTRPGKVNLGRASHASWPVDRPYVPIYDQGCR